MLFCQVKLKLVRGRVTKTEVLQKRAGMMCLLFFIFGIYGIIIA